jgi:hypothetical protein
MPRNLIPIDELKRRLMKLLRKKYEEPNWLVYKVKEWCGKLTPKGLGDPYVGFSDSRQAAVNSFYF